MHWTHSLSALSEPLERRVLLSSVVTVTTTADSGGGSLRDAIDFANSNTNTLTTIRFDLSGSGVQTILPLSQLPAITSQVDIQGTTDSAGDPLVELDGHLAGGSGVDGLIFDRAASGDTKSSTVSGLIIDRFSEDGLRIQGSEATDVFGCRIGTDSTGKHAHPNAGDGIFVNTPGCQIGQAGLGESFGNLISNNGGDGVEIGPSGDDAIVQNCLIGTDVTGKVAHPNGGQGILINATEALIGGRRAHQGNVISGNLQRGILVDFGDCDILGNRVGTNASGTKAIANQDAGIALDNVANVSIGDGSAAGRNVISANAAEGIVSAASSNFTIDGDFIGTDITGTAAMGNSLDGISINQGEQVSVMNSTIGDCDKGITTDNCSDITISFCDIGIDQSLQHSLANEFNGIELTATTDSRILANTIADNGTNGVELDDNDSTADTIGENNIFSNQHLGINFGDDDDTPLPNHSGTVAGPNDDQNYPVLTSAIDSGGQTFVKGSITAAPNADYLIDYFSNDAADPSGFGEGQKFLSGSTVVTDGSGVASLDQQVSGNLPAGQFITATATFQPTVPGPGDTSEFSQAIPVTGASIVGTVFNDANGNGKFDPGETGLKGRTVFIDTDDDGMFNPGNGLFATTDAHGHFRIFGVPPGANRVRLLGFAGWQQTFPSPKAAFVDLNVKALSEKSGIPFGEEKSTAKPATLAVDAGSESSYVDLSGQTFAADTQHPEDDPDCAFPVGGTDDDPLYYMAETASKFDYNFTVPNGNYTMKLLFADPISTAAGQRTFNVTANGASVLKHFDIFAATGVQGMADTQSIKLSITNKTLALVFKGIVGEAIVSAIELIPA
jgi:hypothetical protein